MMNPRLSIQRHLVLYLTGVISALFGLSSVGVYFFMQHAFYEQADKNLMRVAEDFIAETERKLDGGLECEFHELNLENFRATDSGNEAYYELRDFQGKSLIRSLSLSDDEHLPYRLAAGGGSKIENFNLPGLASGRIIFASFPLLIKGVGSMTSEALAGQTPLTTSEQAFVESYDESDEKNRVFLVITESTDGLNHTLFILASALGITGILLVGTTFMLVPKLVQNAFRPVVKITRLTEQMEADNLQSKLPSEQVPIELQALIVKFNQLIERLDAAIHRERRFSLNLAHELRTPVAEIRSLMEVAVDSFDKDARNEANEVCRQGAMISQRMSKIIEVLTAIHQGESETFEINNEPLSIDESLQKAIGTLDSKNQKRVQGAGQVSNSGEIESDPGLLRAVIDNLLTNAVVHSAVDSPVTVSSHADGFSITNTVKDLEQADLPFLKEPFWQQDAARSDPDRFGLGLTLVEVYLRLLNGGMEHKLEADKLTTKVTLPKQVTSG
ncbi:MAG: ATP-binding protein [Verrucomicrobiota bacterium]